MQVPVYVDCATVNATVACKQLRAGIFPAPPTMYAASLCLSILVGSPQPWVNALTVTIVWAQLLVTSFIFEQYVEQPHAQRSLGQVWCSHVTHPAGVTTPSTRRCTSVLLQSALPCLCLLLRTGGLSATAALYSTDMLRTHIHDDYAVHLYYVVCTPSLQPMLLLPQLVKRRLRPLGERPEPGQGLRLQKQPKLSQISQSATSATSYAILCMQLVAFWTT